MASKKEKLIAEALKLVEKGKYDLAVKTYLLVVGEDDKDVRIWLKIGDLYTKLRKNHEAAETYQRVAQFYSDQGFYTKAIAVYKQILKLDPSMVEVYERLADLYKQMGILPDAIEQYASVAAHYQKSGDMRAALSALKQIVELDPQNVASRVKLAEMYSKEQMVREATDEFARAAEFLHEQGRYDDYMKVAERLLFHAPDNRPVSRELARLYLQKDDARRALPRLQVCFKADPRDVETLSLLADAFNALDQRVKAVSVLKELVRIHTENGASSAVDETWKRVLALAPDDGEALRATGSSPPPQREAPPPPRTLTSIPPPRPLASPSLDLSTAPAPRVKSPTVEVPAVRRSDPPPPMAQAGAPPPPTPALARPTPPVMPVASQSTRGAVQQAALFTQTLTPVREPTGPMSGTGPAPRLTPSSIKVTGSQPLMLGIDEAEVAKILVETDVFMKYNLHAKAVEHIKTVFDRDPYNVPAREKLKSLYVALNRLDEAVDELKQLAQLRPGSDEEADYLKEILALAPNEQWARERLMAASAGGAVMQTIDEGDTTGEANGEAPEEMPAHLEVDLDVDMDGVEELSAHDLEEADGDGETEPEMHKAGDSIELDFDEPIAATAASGGDDGIPLVVHAPGSAPVVAVATEIEDRFGADLDSAATGDHFDVEPAFAGTASRDEASPPMASAIAEVPAAEAVDNFDFSSFDDPSRAEAAAAPPPPLAPTVEIREHSRPRIVTPPPPEVFSTPVSDEDAAPRTILAEDSGPSPSGIEDELEEAEFYVAQGMLEEAREVLTQLLVRYPGHALVVARLRDLDEAAPIGESTEATVAVALDEIVQTHTVTSRAPLDPRDSVDPRDPVAPTGSADPEAHGSAAPEVAAPSLSTRKNVVEKGINEDDFESHFDLGIAYREMGIIDDAIAEFELVMKDPTRQVQCRQMLGLCYLAKGNINEAIKHFRQGLHAEGIHEDEELSLYYELGQAYEKLNDTIEALYYYERISKRKSRYRDVERRIKMLAPPAADAL